MNFPVSRSRATVPNRFAFTPRLLALGLLLPVSSLLAAEDDPITAARALYRERGKSVEAQAAFDAIAAADPKNHVAQLHLGLLALRRDDTEKAIAHLERAIALSPNNGDSHKALGDACGRSAQKASVFKQLGFAKRCVASYERAVALAPDRVDYRLSLFEYYYRAPGIVGGGRDKALAEAATIKKLDDLGGRILFARVAIDDKKIPEAFAQFEEVLTTAPDDYNALYQIGRLSALTGQQLDRGLATLRRCLELTPPAKPSTPSHANVHWRIGTLLEKKSDPAGARASYETSVKLDPTFTSATEALKKLK
ncbi:MAG: tetratricopeptide repeat protein [Verrucomicrobiota bacterium]